MSGGLEDLAKGLGGAMGEGLKEMPAEVPEVVEGAAAVEAAPEVAEVGDELVSRVANEADKAGADAELMLKPYTGAIKTELPPEDASALDSELGEVDKEIGAAVEEFHRGVEAETAEETKITTNEVGGAPDGADLEEQKSRTAHEMANKGEGENLPENPNESSVEPEVQKPEEFQQDSARPTNETDSKPENSQEYPEGMAMRLEDGNWIIWENGKWVDAENLDPETQDFVNENDFDKEFPGFSDKFTEEQRQRYNEYFGRYYVYGRQGPENMGQENGASVGGRAGARMPEVRAPATEAAEAQEDREARELMKLLIRLAIKASVKVAAIVAKNIAKSMAKDDPELAAVAGAFGDIISAGGEFADTLVAGEKGASLGEDIYAYFSERHSKQEA